MSNYTTQDLLNDGDGVEASGHPTSCQEPATGAIDMTNIGITVNGQPVGNANNSQLVFSSHAHDTDIDGNCVDNQSHDITPTIATTGITINGNNALLTGTIRSTDPVTGGDITDT